MKALTEQELKTCQLEVFKEIHEFCVEHNLTYYMVYGTLLGAVRHKGYIPWDDDIDIAMPREDYEKFIQTYNRNNSNISECVHISINKAYYLDFAKVYDKRNVLIERINKPMEIGTYIDIFPIDTMPDDQSEAESLLAKIHEKEKYLRILNRTGSGKFEIIKSIMHSVYRLLFTKQSRYETIQSIERLGSKFCKSQTNHVSIAVGGFPMLKDYVPKEWYSEPVLMQFENEMFYAPANSHKLLQRWYGDYMTPPPVEEQHSHHSFNAYWK